MNRVRATQRLGADLAKPDMVDLAVALSGRPDRHRLLDGLVAIDAVDVVKVDPLDPERLSEASQARRM